MKISQEIHFPLIAIRTDGQTHKLNYRVASLVHIKNSLFVRYLICTFLVGKDALNNPKKTDAPQDDDQQDKEGEEEAEEEEGEGEEQGEAGDEDEGEGEEGVEEEEEQVEVRQTRGGGARKRRARKE